MRRVSRLQITVLVLVVALAVGLGAMAVAEASNTHSASSLGPSGSAPTPEAAASAFGLAYLSVLEGRSRASHLALGTAAVRQTAAEEAIPKADQSGPLTLAEVHLSGRAGARADALVVAEDSHHDYPFSLALTRTTSGWVVSGLQPPDLGVILEPAAPKPAAPPAAAQRLAERLAKGAKLIYSPLQHGVLPVTAGRRTFFLRERRGRWSLWYIQG
jgi:hypothetical protein